MVPANFRMSVVGTKDGAGFTGSVTLRLTETAAFGGLSGVRGTADFSQELTDLFDAPPDLLVWGNRFANAVSVSLDRDCGLEGCGFVPSQIAWFDGGFDGPNQLRGDIGAWVGGMQAEGLPLTFTRQ